MGTWGPAEIWQRVPRTHPNGCVTLLNSKEMFKKCEKTSTTEKLNRLSKILGILPVY